MGNRMFPPQGWGVRGETVCFPFRNGVLEGKP